MTRPSALMWIMNAYDGASTDINAQLMPAPRYNLITCAALYGMQGLVVYGVSASVMRWPRHIYVYCSTCEHPGVWCFHMKMVWTGESSTNSTRWCICILFADTMKKNFQRVDD